MENEFHIILPSDSSMKYHPDNTATKFTTTLPRQINLNGQWTVALKEIQYPCNFRHIRKGDATLDLLVSGEAKLSSIPEGVYNTIENLVDVINNTETLKGHFEIEYSGRASIIRIKRTCPEQSKCLHARHKLYLTPRLNKILGLDQKLFSRNDYMIWERSESDDINVKALIAQRPASLLNVLPQNMYVYSDICSSYITGDVLASLLRIVPVNCENYQYGLSRTIAFTSLNYIPLRTNTFRTIEIDIRDGLGGPIPFDYGPLNLTLHFKRVD